MTEEHKVECDRCGRKQSLRKSQELTTGKTTYELPDNWEQCSLHYAGVVVDLCPGCERKRQGAMELFMNKNLDIEKLVKQHPDELQAFMGENDEN